MRLLKIPNAYPHRVAYTGSQYLLATYIQRKPYVPYTTRLWNLAQDVDPVDLPSEQATLAHLLFRPGGAQYLRVHGAWPEGEPLPISEHAESIENSLLVKNRSALQAFAFAPDGAPVLYRHAGMIDNTYQTHFYLKNKDESVHDMYRAWGMFTTSAEFSPNGRLAAMSNGMKVVAVWDVIKRHELLRLEQSDKVSALAFVSNEHLVVAAGRSVRLWDVNSGQSISKFRAFRKYAEALAVSHDLKLFAAGSRDGMIRIWDTASGREVKEYDWDVGEIKELAFSPDGTTAAAAGTSSIAIWDVD